MTRKGAHRYASDTKRQKVTIDALCEMAPVKSRWDFLVNLSTKSAKGGLRPAVQASDGDGHHVLTRSLHSFGERSMIDDERQLEKSRRVPRIGAGRRGFSIIELTIVLILIGLIAGFAVPRVNYSRYRADGAMRTVMVVLQGAQRNAIMRQTNVVVAFDMAGRRMYVVEDANNNCIWDSGERKTIRPLEDGAKFAIPASPYGGSVSAAVSGANTCTMLGFPAIQFLRDGAASTDLNAYVTSSKAAATDFRLVRVTMATGRSDAYRYTGLTWTRTN